jgi:hypothetical protein
MGTRQFNRIAINRRRRQSHPWEGDIMANMTMTKAEALKIQAEQIAWYSRHGDRPWLAEKIAAMTTADALEDGKAYPVHVINKHIPRGADIEYLCGILHRVSLQR